MKLLLEPNEIITIELDGVDGAFQISWGKGSLTVCANIPDTKGRTGVIYEKVFQMPDESELDEDSL